MSKKRTNWHKMANDWYEDELLCAIGDEQPEVFAVWPVLCAKAKAKSNVEDNPDGTIKTTVKKLAACVSLEDRPEVVGRVLDLLSEAEMAEVERGRVGIVRVTLSHFRKWNHPKGSDAERKEQHRDERAGEKGSYVTELSQSVTEASQVRHTDKTRGEERRTEREYLSDETQTSSAALKVSAMTAKQVEAAVANSRAALGERLSAGVDGLAMVMAEENKTGKVQLTRVLRELWQPMVALADEFPEAILLEAMRTAYANRAPNKTYVRKVALGLVERGYTPAPVAAPQPVRGGVDHSAVGAGDE